MSKELLEKYQSIVAKQRSIVEKAQSENNRSLTGEEAESFNKLDEDAKSVKRSIEATKTVADRELEVQELDRELNSAPKNKIDISKRDMDSITRHFKWGKMIDCAKRGMSLQSGSAEKEIADIGYKSLRESGITPKSEIVVPSFMLNKRAITATGGSPAGAEGGYTIQNDIGQTEGALFDDSFLGKLGARIMTGMVNQLTIPRRTYTPGPSFVAELGTSPKAAYTFTKKTFSPYRIPVQVDITREMMVQNNQMERSIVDELRNAIIEKVEYEAIAGSGTDAPTGILNESLVNSVLSDSGDVKWTTVINMMKAIAQKKAYRGNSLGFVAGTTVAFDMMATLKDSVAGAAYLWSEANTVAGHKAVMSNGVPLDIDEDKTALIFGNWAYYYLLQWGNAYELIRDEVTQADDGIVTLTLAGYFDGGSPRGDAFSAVQDIATT